jgi:hypothetical protein
VSTVISASLNSARLPERWGDMTMIERTAYLDQLECNALPAPIEIDP